MKKTVDSCFDEEKTAYALLTFSKERRSSMKRLYENNSYPYIYILIVKYLLDKEYSLDDILKILRRHAVIVSYYIIKKESKKFSNDEYLDELIKRDNISIDTLDANNEQKDFVNNFENLYFASDFKKYRKDITSIISDYESNGKDVKWISGLLKNFFNYFSNNCGFRDLNYYDHFDLVLTHCMNDDRKLSKFEFDCDNAELNWISTRASSNDYKKACLGQVINIIFENDNLVFNRDMKFKVLYYYSIMVNETRKNNIKDTLNFFEIVGVNERIAKIDTKELKEFNFKYNGKDYLFSKNGIIEL